MTFGGAKEARTPDPHNSIVVAAFRRDDFDLRRTVVMTPSFLNPSGDGLAPSRPRSLLGVLFASRLTDPAAGCAAFDDLPTEGMGTHLAGCA